ncbi:HAMP domain-containing sensor histidine kinase [uncultured Clostridium sp.]|uniref:sensor histidine kinase n=1 Tax=uncultured Clostridium sp. TaxID=59620 RepID=UPI002625C265|nr:HAMP domain-containing sensor histidine kinase [uncultured Clostridium sp.]
MFNKNKLSKKLYLIIILIIVIVFGSTYFLNNYFLSKYYVYRTRTSIDKIYNYSKSISLNEFMDKEITLEKNDNITIINLSDSYLSNINSLNDEIQLKLNQSKINVSKLWITKIDVSKLNKEGYINKIFYQDKLQSNYFVKIFKKDGEIILIGKSMANDIETINIVNTFNFYITSVAVIISLILVWLFTRKTVESIETLKEQAKNIGSLNFKAEEIRTGDEIEELSKTINTMSKSLEKAHMELEKKNEDLKILLSSISHEVKTPLSLIKAYAIAINDGLDDGSFSDIIIEQVDNTTKLVENILDLSRVQRSVSNKENFDFENLLEKVLLKFEIQLKNKKIKIIKEPKGYMDIYADKESIEIVLNNFISNGIKYNTSNYIKISYGNGIFSIENKQNGLDEEKLKNIWKPFYVGEKSRSKELSGTGIGLSIVEEILKREKIMYGVTLKEDKIKFYMMYKRKM